MGLELTCSENSLSTGKQKHPVNEAIIPNLMKTMTPEMLQTLP